MPKTVRKDLIRPQFNNFSMWEMLYAVTPKDDPLREDIIKARDAALWYNDTKQFATDPDSGEEVEVETLPDEITVSNDQGEEVTLSGSDLLAQGDFDLGIPPTLNVSDKGVQKRANNDLKLLDKLEKKYKNTQGHDYLNATVQLIKTQTQNLKKGIGYDRAPGSMLYNDFTGIAKMTDVMFDIPESAKTMGNDLHGFQFKDPKTSDKTATEFGVSDLINDYTTICKHNAEWTEEWFKDAPDPKKFRVIADKFRADMKVMDGHIKKFEQKFLEDLNAHKADPTKPMKAENITLMSDIEKDDLIADTSKPNLKKDARYINGPHWEEKKEKLENEISKQLTAVDFKALKRNVKPSKRVETVDDRLHKMSQDKQLDILIDDLDPDDSFNLAIDENKADPQEEYKKLAGMVDDMIDGCSEAYYSSDELVNNRKKAQFAYSYIVQAQKLLEMKQLAECFPEDKYAQAVKKTAEEHLADPQVLKNLGRGEEEKINEKIDNTKLEPETQLIKDQQEKMRQEFKGQNEVPEGMTPEQHLEAERQKTIDHAARMLAVQTIGKAIKTQKALMDDLSDSDPSQALTEDDIKEMTDELLTEENIQAATEQIKEREDFKSLSNYIGQASWQQLKTVRNDALEGEGQKLFADLHKHTESVNRQHDQAERLREQNLEAQKQAQMAKQNNAMLPQ